MTALCAHTQREHVPKWNKEGWCRRDFGTPSASQSVLRRTELSPRGLRQILTVSYVSGIDQGKLSHLETVLGGFPYYFFYNTDLFFLPPNLMNTEEIHSQRGVEGSTKCY